MDTDDRQNPLRAVLDEMTAKGIRNAVRALVDATDRTIERHQIHAWARESGYPPGLDQRQAIDLGLKRLGFRRGLSEVIWKPWIKAVKDARRASDKRRAEVRVRESLPPFRGSPVAGGGRASHDAPPAIE